MKQTISTTLCRPIRAAGLALAVLTLPARAGVIVVDAGGGAGASYQILQDAVDAALEGDTILVRDGTYVAARIVGKSVSLVADGASVHVDEGVRVSDLAAGQQVLVRGLRSGKGFYAVDCDGAVWFDDVVALTSFSVFGSTVCVPLGSSGGYVLRSHRVTFTRCELTGGMAVGGTGWLVPGQGSGVYLSDATAHLFDCLLTGADGPTDPIHGPLPGGAGLWLRNGAATVIGCTIVGGAGGVRTSSICSAIHPPGGPGVLFELGGTVRAAETTASGGVRSLEPLCPGQLGPAGPAISGTGTIVPLPGYARRLEANAPVRGGEELTFEVEGLPGELVIVCASPLHDPLAYGTRSLLLGLPPTDVFLLGVLPPSGRASLSLPIHDVGVGIGGLTYYAQAVFLDPAPAAWLGPGTSTVLVDSSF